MPFRIAPLRSSTGALVFAPLSFAAAVTTPPTITLIGASSITLSVGAVWTDPGATAIDSSGTSIPVVATGTVSTASPGTRIVTYTASDSYGNTASVQRTIFVTAVSPGEIILGALPDEVVRYGTFNIIVDQSFVAPTQQNTTVRVNGATGPALVVTGVTGTGPWTIAVLARFDVPLQFSAVGYPLHITIGDESVQTESVPMYPAVTTLGQRALSFVNLTSVATGPGTLYDHFPHWTLTVGDQIVYTSQTMTSRVPVNVLPSGVPVLLGQLLAADTFGYRVIKADGTISPVPPNLLFEFQPDDFIPDVPIYPLKRTVSWAGDRTPMLVIGDTFYHQLSLLSDGQPFNISASTDVSVCIVNHDHTARLSTPVNVVTHSGWASGLITVNMDATTTAVIAEHVQAMQFGFMEIQVTLSGRKYTWFGAVRLVPGHIQ